MAYGAFARPRRGDVEAPADERRRRFERTGIAAAGLCIFLLVVAMFVNAHNRRTAAFVAETHSDVVLLACAGSHAVPGACATPQGGCHHPANLAVPIPWHACSWLVCVCVGVCCSLLGPHFGGP